MDELRMQRSGVNAAEFGFCRHIPAVGPVIGKSANADVIVVLLCRQLACCILMPMIRA
jgi:hypothetical protein